MESNTQGASTPATARPTVAFVCVLIGIIIGVVFLLRKRSRTAASPADATVDASAGVQTTNIASAKAGPAKSKGSKGAPVSSSLLFVRTLKVGHTDSLTHIAFVADGCILSSAMDRSLRLIEAASLAEASLRTVRANVDLDHIVSFDVSGDGRNVVAATGNTRELLVYALAHSGGSHSLTLKRRFASGHHADIVTVCLGTGRLPFILSVGQDTTAKLWPAAAAAPLAELDTRQIRNNQGAVSSDGRLVAIATYMPDVKIFEVRASRTGDFESAAVAMALTRHTVEVKAVAFAADGKVAVTGGKDGTIVVWNIDVRYSVGEEPHVLRELRAPAAVDRIAIAPDCRSMAVVCGRDVRLFALPGGDPLGEVLEAHEARVVAIAWAPDSRSFVTASSAVAPARLWAHPSVVYGRG